MKAKEEPVYTKSLLVESVRKAVELSPEQASAVVEAMFDSMIEELQQGGKVEIRHFGSFRRRTRGARRGRNPLTGAVLEVPAKVVVHFTPSQALRQAVNAADLQPVTEPVEKKGSLNSQNQQPLR